MPTTKTYNKAGDKCKVRFKLNKDSVADAEAVSLAGSFSDWVPMPMKKLKDGSASLEQTLDAGSSYHYRYVLDGQHWVNDPQADEYVHSGIDGVHNSVIKL